MSSSTPALLQGAGAVCAGPAGPPLGPVPGTRPRIRAVDGLRALAMFMVFTYHAWQFADAPPLPGRALGHTLRLGAVVAGFPAGVDLFMVLSGFCLFWPLCVKPDAVARWSCGDYARRRLRRIVPPYYAAIVYMTLLPTALVCLYHLLHQPAKWQRLPSVWQYMTHLLFIHTLFPGTWDGIQGAFWSLGLEAQFYVVFPLVVFGYRRWGIGVAAGMAVASVLYRGAAGLITAHSPWVTQFLSSVFFLGRWMQFAAGMAAAWLVARRIRTGALYGARAGSTVLFAALGLYCLALTGTPVWAAVPVRDLLLALAFAAALVALCASRCPARRLFESRALVWLGTISYSVFLIHQNTIYYAGEALKRALHLAGPARFAVLDTAGFALVVGVAFVFFRLFEAPFLNRAPGQRRAFAGAGKGCPVVT